VRREPIDSGTEHHGERLVEIKLSEIGQIAVTVSSIDKALPFYRDALGLTFLFSPAPDLAFLAAGAIRIMLSTPQGAGAVGANSILYFKPLCIAEQPASRRPILSRSCPTTNCGWPFCAILMATWSDSWKKKR
jgi:hypothetical protein